QQRLKLDFLEHLSLLRPHLVIDTGDNIASAASIPVLAEALEPLLRRPGAFVHGSNDMFEPMPKNPARYLLPDPRPAGMTEPRAPPGPCASRWARPDAPPPPRRTPHRAPRVARAEGSPHPPGPHQPGWAGVPLAGGGRPPSRPRPMPPRAAPGTRAAGARQRA